MQPNHDKSKIGTLKSLVAATRSSREVMTSRDGMADQITNGSLFSP